MSNARNFVTAAGEPAAGEGGESPSPGGSGTEVGLTVAAGTGTGAAEVPTAPLAVCAEGWAGWRTTAANLTWWCAENLSGRRGQQVL